MHYPYYLCVLFITILIFFTHINKNKLFSIIYK